MENKEKRNSIRQTLLSESVVLFINGRRYEYKLNDISANGIFCLTNEHDFVPAPKSFVDVEFHLPGDFGLLYISGQVCRVNWNKKKLRNKEPGFAIKYGPISEGNRKILDAYFVYLRNKQIISVSKRIIEEFFGSQRRPK